jgi:hypothetical protein
MELGHTHRGLPSPMPVEPLLEPLLPPDMPLDEPLEPPEDPPDVPLEEPLLDPLPLPELELLPDRHGSRQASAMHPSNESPSLFSLAE